MKEAEVIPLNTEPIRLLGKIVKLDKENGWGFITSPEKRFVRFYFHWTALKPTDDFNSLEINQLVRFEPIDYVDARTNERMGWRAYQIELL
jgi:cold shock CspA family protein